MSDNNCQQTPLVDLLRSVPKDFRGTWPIQWAEDGSETGHAMSPVGRHAHDAADELEALQRKVEELEKALRALIGRAEGEACYHQKRHRGGTIWEICDDCGEKWADDRGGFKKHKEWKELTSSRIALNSTKEST